MSKLPTIYKQDALEVGFVSNDDNLKTTGTVGAALTDVDRRVDALEAFSAIAQTNIVRYVGPCCPSEMKSLDGNTTYISRYGSYFGDGSISAPYVNFTQAIEEFGKFRLTGTAKFILNIFPSTQSYGIKRIANLPTNKQSYVRWVKQPKGANVDDVLYTKAPANLYSVGTDLVQSTAEQEGTMLNTSFQYGRSRVVGFVGTVNELTVTANSTVCTLYIYHTVTSGNVVTNVATDTGIEYKAVAITEYAQSAYISDTISINHIDCVGTRSIDFIGLTSNGNAENPSWSNSAVDGVQTTLKYDSMFSTNGATVWFTIRSSTAFVNLRIQGSLTYDMYNHQLANSFIFFSYGTNGNVRLSNCSFYDTYGITISGTDPTAFGTIDNCVFDNSNINKLLAGYLEKDNVRYVYDSTAAAWKNGETVYTPVDGDTVTILNGARVATFHSSTNRWSDSYGLVYQPATKRFVDAVKLTGNFYIYNCSFNGFIHALTVSEARTMVTPGIAYTNIPETNDGVTTTKLVATKSYLKFVNCTNCITATYGAKFEHSKTLYYRDQVLSDVAITFDASNNESATFELNGDVFNPLQTDTTASDYIGYGFYFMVGANDTSAATLVARNPETPNINNLMSYVQ